MFEFLANTPAIITILTLDIAGILAIIGLFEKGRRDRARRGDEQTKQLIDTMQKRIDLLDTEVKETRTEAKQLHIQYEKLKAENDVLTKVLQGRDSEMIDFIKKGYENRQLNKENNGLLKQLVKSQSELNVILKEHYTHTNSRGSVANA